MSRRSGFAGRKPVKPLVGWWALGWPGALSTWYRARVSTVGYWVVGIVALLVLDLAVFQTVGIKRLKG